MLFCFVLFCFVLFCFVDTHHVPHCFPIFPELWIPINLRMEFLILQGQESQVIVDTVSNVRGCDCWVNRNNVVQQERTPAGIEEYYLRR